MSSNSNLPVASENVPGLARKNPGQLSLARRETSAKATPETEQNREMDCQAQSVSCAGNKTQLEEVLGGVGPSGSESAAFIGVKRHEPSNGVTPQSIAIPVVALILLAVVAVVLGRRRKGQGQLVRVLESTSLGPKRSLVVAQMGNETLLIGSSESGLCLLAARPRVESLSDAQAERPLEKPVKSAMDSRPSREAEVPKGTRISSVQPEPVEGPSTEPVLSSPNGLRVSGAMNGSYAGAKSQLRSDSRGDASENLARLLSEGAAQEHAPSAPFQSLLAESVEDQELRRKFAQGMTGSVR
jgi:flagellar biogenesis protein FliO